MVADINGTTTADVTNLTDVNGTLYFAAYTSANGFQVWQSNGTAAGTVMDTGLATGTTAPSDLTAVGNDLYFTAPGATLWEWAPSSSQATPTITWASPAGITYGTALSAAQLDATASVPGTFTYSPAAGTVLKAGTRHAVGDLHAHRHHRLHDRHRRRRRSRWRRRRRRSPGRARRGSSTGRRCPRPSSTPRPACRGPSPTRRPRAPCWRRGRETLSVTFTPTDTTDYTTATATRDDRGGAGHADDHLAEPGGDRLRHGAVGGAARRDGERPGTFTYSPAAGTVPRAGTDTLSVTFTPTDTTDYTTATADGDDRRGAGDAGDHLGRTRRASSTARRCRRRSSTRRRAWRGPSPTRRPRARCWPRGRTRCR